MAQGRLILAAAVVALGVAAEAAQPAPLWAADLATGLVIGVGAAASRARAPAVLALLTAAAWFAAPLIGALAYRAPLLALLALTLSPSGAAAVVMALLPDGFLRPLSVAAAGALAAAALAATRHAPSDRRRALEATFAAASALVAVWLAVIVLGGSTALTLLNDLVVAAAALTALASGRWTSAAASALVVSLGRTRHPGRPVTTQLARTLADPSLELRYAVPDVGWVDEHGHAVPEPGGEGRIVTRAKADGGGEVALIHDGTADPRLTTAATAAAALALDSARLEAELRARANDLRASRRRLLTTADAERRALSDRLETRVLTRLRRLGNAPELRDAIAELNALGRGLYPAAHANLADLATRVHTPTTVDLDGADELPDTHRAALWFIAAEALANVDKHADAHHAAVRVRTTATAVSLELTDDGRGGATPQHGLRGIADRAEALGGTFELVSPTGGPTQLRVELPL